MNPVPGMQFSGHMAGRLHPQAGLVEMEGQAGIAKRDIVMDGEATRSPLQWICIQILNNSDLNQNSQRE